MNIPELARVAALPPADLLLTYIDATARRFACGPYLDRGAFVRLKEPSVFAQAHLAHGTVCWPGDLDIPPETLFLRSIPVSVEPVAN